MNRRQVPQRGLSALALKWSNAFRTLWEQHVQWTRSFILSKAADAPDLALVTQRLLRNPKDFAQAIGQFYGDEAASTVRTLLEEHLKIGADLVGALKDKQMRLADEARRAWYRNADDMSRALASLNPLWQENAWRRMLYEHLQITEREAALRLSGQYASDIQIYDAIEQQALRMADMMSEGIIRRFSL